MRNIPTVTKNLLIINLLMFAATFVFGRMGTDLNDLLGLHFFMASGFHVYQLFTYMFMHGGLEHIFFNMFALWMFGCVVENVWGPRKFLFFYLVCGIGAGLTQELAQFITFYFNVNAQFPGSSFTDVIAIGHNSAAVLNAWTTVGASGAIYGILLAFGMIFPEERIFIFPLPVPIKAKWFVIIYAAIELFMALNQRGDGVAHVAHLGGMLFGFLLIRYWKRHPGSSSFGQVRGQQFFDGLRKNWEKRSHKSANDYRPDDNPVRHETDWEYNARKKAEQDEVDRILDKIRRSGYDSLTEAEKKKLFENSNQ
ncbi:MAG: rhomboid family intramembrane serine protease [Prevotella sp.]|jgi:membrane associated rhomboid family serine protease|nr:rhomboid family intramembrane serine protease [Prevotella sp.]